MSYKIPFVPVHDTVTISLIYNCKRSSRWTTIRCPYVGVEYFLSTKFSKNMMKSRDTVKHVPIYFTAEIPAPWLLPKPHLCSSRHHCRSPINFNVTWRRCSPHARSLLHFIWFYRKFSWLTAHLICDIFITFPLLFCIEH